MKTLLNKLWLDENGFVVSAELALIATAGVLATVVGLNKVASSVNHELNDVANAFGALDQSYSYEGFCNPGHAWVAGSAYLDTQDECDCAVMISTHAAPKIDGNRGFEHDEQGDRDHAKQHDSRGKGHHDNKAHDGKGIDKKDHKKDRKHKHGDKEAARHQAKHGHHHAKDRAHPHHAGHGHHDHDQHGTHFQHGGTHFRHGDTRILRAENGRPLFIESNRCCPVHPRCVLPCEKCKAHGHSAGKRHHAPGKKPTLAKPKPPAKPELKSKKILKKQKKILKKLKSKKN